MDIGPVAIVHNVDDLSGSDANNLLNDIGVVNPRSINPEVIW